MLTYALNASIKKLEVPIFLSITLLTLGIVPLTPLLMVLLLFANDFATMAITTDRVGYSPQPDRWRVGQLLAGALAVALPLLGSPSPPSRSAAEATISPSGRLRRSSSSCLSPRARPASTSSANAAASGATGPAGCCSRSRSLTWPPSRRSRSPAG